jgi:hypothetical protein
MLPADKIAMGSKISKTMLRHTRGLSHLDGDQMVRLAPLIRQFARAVEIRDRRDTETLAGLVRTLHSPRGIARPTAEKFVELVRGIVRQELSETTRS